MQSVTATPENTLPGPRVGPPPPLEPELVDLLVREALAEDAPSGDLTGALLPEALLARGALVAKSAGRLAGLDLFARAFTFADPGARVDQLRPDGSPVAPGDRVATVEGRARALLLAERTALNFVQRLSGTATLTAAYVERAAGRARILDTRKTTPGWRALERYAVRCGGGENHRAGLSDEVMIKDNHVDLSGGALGDLVRAARAAVGSGVRVTAEARDAQEALEAVEAGADVVLLDNFTPAGVAELAPRLRAAATRALELEASGGIDLDAVAEFARAGVDRLSIGALTHSAPALDLSLELEPAR